MEQLKNKRFSLSWNIYTKKYFCHDRHFKLKVRKISMTSKLTRKIIFIFIIKKNNIKRNIKYNVYAIFNSLILERSVHCENIFI